VGARLCRCAQVERITTIAVLAVAFVLLAILPASASASASWDRLLAPESACPGQSDGSLPRPIQVQSMICMHNWARSQEHLSALSVSRQLRASSNRKAHDIKRCGEFSHSACGRNAFYWEQRFGFFRGTYGAGENLALTYGADTTVRGTMDLWLNSTEHRQNLLMPRYRDVGMALVTGTFHGSRGAHIWVAQFGYHH
jgi:uncharacterized protein YkwD